MSVLRKICGITRRDRRRNRNILKELSIEKDVVEVLQSRRLTYFGHVIRMENDRFPHIYTDTHMVTVPEEVDGQYKRRLYSKEYDSSRSYSMSQGQDKLKKHCSIDGLPEH